MRLVRDDIFSCILSVLFLMLCVFIQDGDAQRPGFGRCPDYPPMKNFDPAKFQGEWYEIERSFYLFELPHSCIKFNFTLNDGLLNVAVFSHNRLTGRSSTSYGRAKPNYLWPAILSYEVSNSLPPMIARMLPGSGKYVILDTDYNHYAILYSCSDLGILHADLLWILGRERDLNVDSRVQVYDHLINLKINTDRLTLSPQKKCPA